MVRRSPKQVTYRVEFEREPDGTWIASVPALRATVQARTRAQARARAITAARFAIESLLEEGSRLPADEPARDERVTFQLAG